MCNGKINKKDKFSSISCSKCNIFFHSQCVKIENSEVEQILTNKQIWNCPSCLIDIRKDSNSEIDNSEVPTPKRPRTTSGDLASQLIPKAKKGNVLSDELSLENIKNMFDEQRTYFNNRFDTLENKFVGMFAELKDQNKKLRDEVDELKYKIDQLEQERYKNSIEIVGVSSNEEDPTKFVVKLLRNGLKLDTINENNIKKCYEIKNRKNFDFPKKIFVDFISDNSKNEVLNKIRKMKNLPASVVNERYSGHIYFNEALTKYKRMIFNKAKEVKRDKNYKYLWMRNATVMMRKEDGGPIAYIRTFGDLDKL